MMNLNLRRLAAALFGMIALFAFAALPVLAQTSNQTPPPAQEIVNTAVAKAKAENKTVFVHFWASW
jgi:hypothetical protein